METFFCFIRQDFKKHIEADILFIRVPLKDCLLYINTSCIFVLDIDYRLVAGYYSSRLYKTMKGLQWKKAAFMVSKNKYCYVILVCYEIQQKASTLNLCGLEETFQVKMVARI